VQSPWLASKPEVSEGRIVDMQVPGSRCSVERAVH
jgi:hypothetical protein